MSVRKLLPYLTFFPALLVAQSPLQQWATSLSQAARFAAAGDNKAAERAYQQAVEAGETLAEQPERLALALNNFGSFYFRTGRPDEAEPLLARAVATIEQAHGAGSQQALDSRFNLGSLYFTAGKLGKASAEFDRVIEGRRKGPKDQRPEAGKAILYLAQIHQAEGRSEKAHAHYMSALQIFTEHPDRYAEERDMAFGMAAGMLDQRIHYTKVRRDGASLRQTMLFLDRAADLHATYGDGALGARISHGSQSKSGDG